MSIQTLVALLLPTDDAGMISTPRRNGEMLQPPNLFSATLSIVSLPGIPSLPSAHSHLFRRLLFGPAITSGRIVD